MSKRVTVVANDDDDDDENNNQLKEPFYACMGFL